MPPSLYVVVHLAFLTGTGYYHRTFSLRMAARSHQDGHLNEQEEDGEGEEQAPKELQEEIRGYFADVDRSGYEQEEEEEEEGEFQQPSHVEEVDRPDVGGQTPTPTATATPTVDQEKGNQPFLQEEEEEGGSGTAQQLPMTPPWQPTEKEDTASPGQHSPGFILGGKDQHVQEDTDSQINASAAESAAAATMQQRESESTPADQKTASDSRSRQKNTDNAATSATRSTATQVPHPPKQGLHAKDDNDIASGNQNKGDGTSVSPPIGKIKRRGRRSSAPFTTAASKEAYKEDVNSKNHFSPQSAGIRSKAEQFEGKHATNAPDNQHPGRTSRRGGAPKLRRPPRNRGGAANREGRAAARTTSDETSAEDRGTTPITASTDAAIPTAAATTQGASDGAESGKTFSEWVSSKMPWKSPTRGGKESANVKSVSTHEYDKFNKIDWKLFRDENPEPWEHDYLSDSDVIDKSAQLKRLSKHRSCKRLFRNRFDARARSFSDSKIEAFGWMDFRLASTGKLRSHWCCIFGHFFIACMTKPQHVELTDPASLHSVVNQCDGKIVDLRFLTELSRKTRSLTCTSAMNDEIKLDGTLPLISQVFRSILVACWTYGCLARTDSELHMRLSLLQDLVEQEEYERNYSLDQILKEHNLDEERIYGATPSQLSSRKWTPRLRSGTVVKHQTIPSITPCNDLENNKIVISQEDGSHAGQTKTSKENYVDELIEERIRQLNQERSRRHILQLNSSERDRLKSNMREQAKHNPYFIYKLMMQTMLRQSSAVLTVDILPEPALSKDHPSDRQFSQNSVLDGHPTERVNALSADCKRAFDLLEKMGWWVGESTSGVLPLDFHGLYSKRKQVRDNILKSAEGLCALHELYDGVLEVTSERREVESPLGKSSPEGKLLGSTVVAKCVSRLVGELRALLVEKETVRILEDACHSLSSPLTHRAFWTTINRSVFSPFLCPPKLWVSAFDRMLEGLLSSSSPEITPGSSKVLLPLMLETTAARESVTLNVGVALMNALYLAETALPRDLLLSRLSISSTEMNGLLRSESVEKLDTMFEDLIQPISTCIARLMCDIIRSIGMDPFDFEQLRPYSDIVEANVLISGTSDAKELQGVLWSLAKRCSPTFALQFVLHEVLPQSIKQVTTIFPWYFAGGADFWGMLKDLFEVTEDALPTVAIMRLRCMLYGIWRLDFSEAGHSDGMDAYLYPLKEACLNSLRRVTQPVYDPLSSGVSVPLGLGMSDVGLFQPEYLTLDMYALTTVSPLDVAYLAAFAKYISDSRNDEEIGSLLNDIQRSWNAYERSRGSNHDWDFDEWMQRVLGQTDIEPSSSVRFPLYVPAASAVACQEASSSIDDIPRSPMSRLRPLREKIVRFIGLSDELECKVTEDNVEPGIEDESSFAMLNSLAHDILSDGSDLSLMRLQESSIMASVSLTNQLRKRLHTVNENQFGARSSILSDEVAVVGPLSTDQPFNTVTSSVPKKVPPGPQWFQR
eukprot:gb/GECG01001386.1/.p1 GENE.gb/GECG01001386.1/~~gb/GECG01001386.1/.p1  ORF type:complete len:1485 (+),score=221.76 gb/GECG01001386.1/:1-4455(+)